MIFDMEEKESLIDFLSSSPVLWNHAVTEYRDRNLRDTYWKKSS